MKILSLAVRDFLHVGRDGTGRSVWGLVTAAGLLHHPSSSSSANSNCKILQPLEPATTAVRRPSSTRSEFYYYSCYSRSDECARALLRSTVGARARVIVRLSFKLPLPHETDDDGITRCCFVHTPQVTCSDDRIGGDCNSSTSFSSP